MRRSVRRTLLVALLSWYAAADAVGALLVAHREGLLAAALAAMAASAAAAAWALWHRRAWAPRALLAVAAAGPAVILAAVGTVPPARRVPDVWSAVWSGSALWVGLLGAAAWWVGRRRVAAA